MRSTVSSMLIVVAAVIGLCFVAPAEAEGEMMPQMGGGWEHINDSNDPHIQELGRWAVSEHIKLAHDGLSFVKVVGGLQQVYHGMNYDLVIEATNGAGKSATYGAIVDEMENKTRQLMAFKRTN